MSADASYPGLEDSWFDRPSRPSAAPGPRQRTLTRAEVLAELSRRQRGDVAAPREPDGGLDDSWFDR